MSGKDLSVRPLWFLPVGPCFTKSPFVKSVLHPSKTAGRFYCKSEDELVLADTEIMCRCVLCLTPSNLTIGFSLIWVKTPSPKTLAKPKINVALLSTVKSVTFLLMLKSKCS